MKFLFVFKKLILVVVISAICFSVMSCGENEKDLEYTEKRFGTSYVNINASMSDYGIDSSSSFKKYYATITIDITKSQDVEFKNAWIKFKSGKKVEIGIDGSATTSYIYSKKSDFSNRSTKILETEVEIDSVGGVVLVPVEK